MKLKPGSLKFILNIFPPFLFSRIIVKRFSKDYREATVRIRRTRLNKNLNSTIFGGTLYSAADPIYALMYWQIFEHRGHRLEAWTRTARIEFLKPGDGHLTLQFALSDMDIQSAEEQLLQNGKIQRWHTVNALNKHGEICTAVHVEIYIRMRDKKPSPNL